jgi:phosphatidylglycerophosphatase A
MISLRQLPLPLSEPACLLATWFGVGRLQPASGTWGSLAALPFAWLINHYGGSLALLAASLLVFGLGCWAAQKYEAASDSHDASAIVIDEVAGQWLCLCLAPANLLAYGLCFALFRLFDIWKPWPISWLDAKVGGGFGVMIDDMLAGLFGLACFVLIWQFLVGGTIF